MTTFWREAIISSGVLLLLFWWIERGKKRERALWLGVLLLAACMGSVFAITGVSPMSGLHWELRPDEISLVPFVGMKKILSQGMSSYAILNLAGNVILFLPLGFFAPMVWKKLDHWGWILLAGCLVSLGIEITQLFLIRGTDIDDILLNTLGTGLGYGLWRLFPSLRVKAAPSPRAGWFLLCVLLPYGITILLGIVEWVRYCAM